MVTAPPLLAVSIHTCGPRGPLVDVLASQALELGHPLRPLPESLHSVVSSPPGETIQRAEGHICLMAGEGEEQMQLQELSFGGRKIWVHSSLFHPGILRQIVTFHLWNGDSTLLARS